MNERIPSQSPLVAAGHLPLLLEAYQTGSRGSGSHDGDITLRPGLALVGDASPAPGRPLRAHGTMRFASSPCVSPHGFVFIPSTLNTGSSPQNRPEHISSVRPTALSCGLPAAILGYPPTRPPAGPWKSRNWESGEALVSGGVSSLRAPVCVKWAKGKRTSLHPLLPGAACRGCASRPSALAQLLPSGTRDSGRQGDWQGGLLTR